MRQLMLRLTSDVLQKIKTSLTKYQTNTTTISRHLTFGGVKRIGHLPLLGPGEFATVYFSCVFFAFSFC